MNHRFEDTNTGRTLRANMDVSLRGYLRDITPPKGFGRTISNTSKAILLRSIEECFPDSCDARDKDQALSAFSDTPIMQLADGSSLFYDPETFLTNFVFQVACRERNLPFLFTQQCSRSKMVMDAQAYMGAGYIRLGDEVYSIFGLSRSRMERASTSTLKGKVSVLFNPLGLGLPAYTRAPLPDLLGDLRGQTFSSAADAILHCNQRIWDGLAIKAKKKLVQFDERLTAVVIARHISDPNSPIFRLLFDPVTRAAYLRNYHEVIDSRENLILKPTTNFFYYVAGETIRAAVINEDNGVCHLIDAETGRCVSVDFTPSSISEALRDGKLFPDLCLSYVVLALLPGVLSFGGSSQHEYLPQIYKILNLTNQETHFVDGEIPDVVANDKYSGSRMITGLIEMTPYIRGMIGCLNRNTSLDDFESDYFDRSLRETLGDMAYYNYFDLFLPRSDVPDHSESAQVLDR